MTQQLHGLIEPVIDPDAVAFWDGVANGQLLVPTCMGCGNTFFPPLSTCPRCAGELIELVQASGAARLYSWVVMRRALDPAFVDAVPYVVAAVDLAEGARLFARLIGVDIDDPDALQADMALQLEFVEIDGRPMWAFAPAVEGATVKDAAS